LCFSGSDGLVERDRTKLLRRLRRYSNLRSGGYGSDQDRDSEEYASGRAAATVLMLC
jgi:hypothetical protein